MVGDNTYRTLLFKRTVMDLLREGFKYDGDIMEDNIRMVFNISSTDSNEETILEFTTADCLSFGPFITINVMRYDGTKIGVVDVDTDRYFLVDISLTKGVSDREYSLISIIVRFFNTYDLNKYNDEIISILQKERVERIEKMKIWEEQQKEAKRLADKKKREEEERRKAEEKKAIEEAKKEAAKKENAEREAKLETMIHLYTPTMDYVKSCMIKVAMKETGANLVTILRKVNTNKVYKGFIWESEYL